MSTDAAADPGQTTTVLITAEQVRHVALLGRLKLTDQEVVAFAHELSAILEYINQLRAVDVDGVEPMAHAVALTNVMREDEPRPSLPPGEAVGNAPDRENSFFKVPKVLDQDV